MSSEAELVIDVWEVVRDHLSASKRADIARDMLYVFADFGFTATDLAEIVEEDPDLTAAYEEVFEPMEAIEEEDPYEE
jgi:hypothetical protein